MIIIGIAGGTGSGKTTVVRRIIESLSENEVAVLPNNNTMHNAIDIICVTFFFIRNSLLWYHIIPDHMLLW